MSSFGERFNWAFLQLQVREGRVLERTEIGRRVSAGLGREKAYTSQAVGGWLTTAEPGSDVTMVLAEILGVDPGWLAFGEASGAPAPEGWVPAPADQEGEKQPPEEPMTDDVTRRRAGEAGVKGILEAEALERGEHPQQQDAKGKRRRRGRG